MRNKVEKIWNIVGLPLIFLAVVASLWFAWKIFNLPPEDELIILLKQYFNLYGLWLIFLSALIEGMLLVGLYYPGSLVIFLGVILAGNDISHVLKIIAVVTLGLLLSYAFNYFLGRGWYRLLIKCGLEDSIEHTKRRLMRHESMAIFLTYWQPNLAALTATAAGILHYPFKKFIAYSLLASVLWNIFWGVVAYFFGEVVLAAVGIRFVLLAALGWIIFKFVFTKEHEHLFVYGTLMDPLVQKRVIGRVISGVPDTLLGFEKTELTINGETFPAIIPKEGNKIFGLMLSVTVEELKKIDEYETSAYARTKVTLQSKTKAWVYVAA